MSRSFFVQDLRKVVNGLMKVANASAINHQSRCETIIRNSSIVKGAQDAPEVIRKVLNRGILKLKKCMYV